MAIYKLQGEDGQTLSIEGPDDATDDELIQIAEAYTAQPKAQPSVQTESSNEPGKFHTYVPEKQGYAADLFDTVGGGLLHGAKKLGAMAGIDEADTQNFFAGMGKAGYDAAQGIGQLVGLQDESDIEATRKRDRGLMESKAGFAGNIAGNIATTLPLAAVPGINTARGGALAGSLLGTIQGRGEDDSIIKNAFVGGAVGAALPAVTSAWRTLKDVAAPNLSSDRVLGSLLSRQAGNTSAERQAVVNALRDETRRGATEGVNLSAAQMTENRGLASLEDMLQTNGGSALNRSHQVNRNRLAEEMRGIAGDDVALESAKAARSSAAEIGYGEANLAGTTIPAHLVEKFEAVGKKLPQKVYNKLNQVARLRGEEPGQGLSMQNVQVAKGAFDDMIGAAKKAGDSTLAREMMVVKQELMNTMDEISPGWKAANAKFAEDSKVIDKLKVATHFKNKLIPATAGDNPASLNYSSFATSMRDPDKHTATATRMPGKKYGDVFGPEEQLTMKNLLSDSSRISEGGKRGSGLGSATAERWQTGRLVEHHLETNVPKTNLLLKLMDSVPGLGRALDYLKKPERYGMESNNSRLISQLDDLMANNPEKVAKLIEGELSRLSPTERRRVVSALPQAVVLSLPSNLQ